VKAEGSVFLVVMRLSEGFTGQVLAFLATKSPCTIHKARKSLENFPVCSSLPIQFFFIKINFKFQVDEISYYNPEFIKI
jgi:hypothetical protein